ncbi:uracil-DNA glycosylase [Acidihalobacter prosperus]
MGIQPWALRAAPRVSGQCSPVAADAAAEEIALANMAPAPVAAGHVTAGARADVAEMDWPRLEAAVAACRRCALAEGRTQTVFGVGERTADWMVVGEGPGAEEDRRGEPFVGRAGRLLDNMFVAIGLRREAVYIANVVKCRPPGNRDPQPEEVSACGAYLDRQIALVQPRLILALGRFAAQSLLQTDTPVGQLRGRVHRYAGTIPLIVTYHPAYLLRSPEQKARAWDDLRLARAQIAGDG